MQEVKSRVRRATAADVAKAAGVSQATVSYVLNASPYQTIPEETRRRVTQAASDLRYTPHSAARTLRRGRSDNVLLLTPNWPTGTATAELLDLLANEFQRFNLTLVTKRMSGSQSISSAWQNMAPAAVVVITSISEDETAAMRDAGVFVAQVVLDDTQNGALVIPQDRIGALQAQHLIDRGHRQIGYAGLVDPRIETFRDLRLKGVADVCARAGADQPVVTNFQLELSEAIQAIRFLRDRPVPVTAICAYNDEYAFALLAAARRLNLSVPTDLAVIGVADLKISQFADPPLTTVQINQQRLAEKIAEFVTLGINGSLTEERAYLDTYTLVEREST